MIRQNSVLYKIEFFFYIFVENGRGCRQGDHVSPYIFNLCVIIMRLMIRQNESITGNTIVKEIVSLFYNMLMENV